MGLLESQKTTLRTLHSADFSHGYQVYKSDIQNIHLQLQNAMVSATRDIGQSEDDLLRKVKPLVEKLKSHWT